MVHFLKVWGVVRGGCFLFFFLWMTKAKRNEILIQMKLLFNDILSQNRLQWEISSFAL